MKSLSVAVLAFVISGCMSYGTKYSYTYRLSKPDSPSMTWQDERASFAFQISDKSVNFTIRNKSQDVLKIIWDEATIIREGKADKVMHSGVKYIDRNNSQPATTIPPNSAIDDLAMPTESVYYVTGQYGGWREHDLFPTQDLNEARFKNMILNAKGQRFSLYLPIQVQGKTVDYNFEFEIVDVAQLR
ncbi:MAG: hypothetical protein V1799_10225 [bacterium]